MTSSSNQWGALITNHPIAAILAVGASVVTILGFVGIERRKDRSPSSEQQPASEYRPTSYKSRKIDPERYKPSVNAEPTVPSGRVEEETPARPVHATPEPSSPSSNVEAEPAGEALVGVWEQQSLMASGDYVGISRFSVSKRRSGYRMTLQGARNGVVLPVDVRQIEFDGSTWTFQSVFANGGTLDFRLEKIADGVFEGRATGVGFPLQINRWIRVD
jgi:hypothetical protein